MNRTALFGLLVAGCASRRFPVELDAAAALRETYCPEAVIVNPMPVRESTFNYWVVEGCGRSAVVMNLSDGRPVVIDRDVRWDVRSEFAGKLAEPADALSRVLASAITSPAADGLHREVVWAETGWIHPWERERPYYTMETLRGDIDPPHHQHGEYDVSIAPEQVWVRTWQEPGGAWLGCGKIVDPAGASAFYRCRVEMPDGSYSRGDGTVTFGRFRASGEFDPLPPPEPVYPPR